MLTKTQIEQMHRASYWLQKLYNDGLKNPDESLTNELNKLFTKGWTLVENEPCVAFVGRRGANLLVLFRGTDTERRDIHVPWRDYITWPLIRKNGKSITHAKYENHLDLIWNQLQHHFTSELHLPWTEGLGNVVFAGHSLGGALALIAGKRLLDIAGDDINCNVHVITYGAPQCGNLHFNDQLANHKRCSIIRLIHANDIIPRLGIPFVSRGSSSFKNRKHKRSDITICMGHTDSDWRLPTYPKTAWERWVHYNLINVARYGFKGLLRSHFPHHYWIGAMNIS